MNQEKVLIFGGFTEEEAKAIKEAARIWAERVRIAIEEAVAAFSNILLQIGPPDLEALDDLRKELEEIEREPRPAAEDGAEPGAGHRKAIPGGDSPCRAGKVL